MGRTRKEINWDSVVKRMEAGNTAKQIAKALDVHLDTFYDNFKREFGCNFSDYSVSMPECKKGNLEYAQYMKAMSGDTKMLIHLGKFELGQNDKIDIENEIQKQLTPWIEKFKSMIERNPVKE